MLYAVMLAMVVVVYKNINKSLAPRWEKSIRFKVIPTRTYLNVQSCVGVGAFYNPNGITAGLKLNPEYTF